MNACQRETMQSIPLNCTFARLLTSKIFIISNVFIILLNMIWTGVVHMVHIPAHLLLLLLLSLLLWIRVQKGIWYKTLAYDRPWMLCCPYILKHVMFLCVFLGSPCFCGDHETTHSILYISIWDRECIQLPLKAPWNIIHGHRIRIRSMLAGIYADGLVTGRNSSAGRYDAYFIVESLFSGAMGYVWHVGDVRVCDHENSWGTESFVLVCFCLDISTNYVSH